MSSPRFFADAEVPERGVLPLGVEDVHHLRDVLRLRPGATIELGFAGSVWRVRLDEVSETVSGTVVARVSDVRPLTPVTLAQALAKGEKMDTVIRQATELGVARIVPFTAERSVVRLDADKARARTARWRRIAEGAAKQAHLAAVPEVSEPVVTAGLPESLGDTLMLLAWEESDDAPGIAEVIASAGDRAAGGVSVIVGPEGGLTPDEVRTLTDAGAHIVSLGQTILRTETAAVVAAALAVHALGGLGARHG